MKRTLYCGLMILMSGGGLIAYVMAQQPATHTSAAEHTIQQAQVLIREHKPLEARTVLATIPETAPEYPLAKHYDALAQHEAKDRLGFLKSIEKLPATSGLPATLSADLTVRQIEALLFYRNFEELLPKARAFLSQHPAAAESAAVQDYLLAALFERGMKKTKEACNSKDEAVFNIRWPEGKADLEEFLALAARVPHTNYLTLPKRNLSQDIYLARIVMGGGDKVLQEISATDAAARQNISYLRLQMFQKLQRDRTEQNANMIKDFLKEFPETKQQKRLEFDLATLNFCLGEKLAKQADVDESAGNVQAAVNNRKQASQYFEAQRALQLNETNKDAGIEISDLMEMRADLLYGYFLEKNYQEVSDRADEMVAKATPGEIAWIIGKVYQGIVLVHVSPPKVAQAKESLESVMALEFKNKPDHDYYVLLAARWRIYLALSEGDRAKGMAILDFVRSSQCAKNQKIAFLKYYAQKTNEHEKSTQH